MGNLRQSEVNLLSPGLGAQWWMWQFAVRKILFPGGGGGGTEDHSRRKVIHMHAYCVLVPARVVLDAHIVINFYGELRSSISSSFIKKQA